MKTSLVIIEVNEHLLIKNRTFNIKILVFYKKAWPGKVEMLYFLFTVCWNTFRALRTSNTDFLFLKAV